MSLVRVQSFAISLDGFGTGEGQSLETPFGHAGHRLHEWMAATKWGATMFGNEGGSRGVDEAFVRQHSDPATNRSAPERCERASTSPSASC